MQVGGQGEDRAKSRDFPAVGGLDEGRELEFLNSSEAHFLYPAKETIYNTRVTGKALHMVYLRFTPRLGRSCQPTEYTEARS